VILAVHDTSRGPVDAARWQQLSRRGIYLQVYGAEGEVIWNSGGRPLVVLVWNSHAALAAADQPLMIWCRLSASNAGPDSALQGTNQSTAPMAGFDAVVFDAEGLAASAASQNRTPTTVALWSDRRVEVFDIQFPTTHTDSSQVDGETTPTYQFYLEIEHVVFPAEGPRPKAPDYLWSRNTFAVASDRKEIRLEKVPGYLVSPERAEDIRRCLQEVLGVDPGKGKVGPVSEYDQPKIGKRTAAHALHDTYIAPSTRERRDEFYGGAAHGSFLADLDPARGNSNQRELFVFQEPEPIRRVQRVFTTRREDLLRTWLEAALRLRQTGSH
jgi:hypothetical protein